MKCVIMITSKYSQEQKDAFLLIEEALENDIQFQEYKDSFYLEDQGIGSFEYWGFKGSDVQLVPVSEEGDLSFILEHDLPEFDYFLLPIEVEVTHNNRVLIEKYNLTVSFISKNEVQIG